MGAAFLFTVGLFIRAARAAQARARAAQARAEGLLAELRASQAAQAEAAALTERTRLAREIHDILAHSLSGLVLALDTAELLARRGGAGPDAAGGAPAGPAAPGASGADTDTVALMLGQVNRAQRIAREGLADTRRAISALRGDELPGPALLDRLVRQHVRGDRHPGGARPWPANRGRSSPEVGLALYRTAQEALINTAKYAGRGGRAELSLTYRTDGIELAIEDARAPGAAPPSVRRADLRRVRADRHARAGGTARRQADRGAHGPGLPGPAVAADRLRGASAATRGGGGTERGGG